MYLSDEETIRNMLEMTKHLNFENRLRAFAKESNKIEGINSDHAHDRETEELRLFLSLPELKIDDVCKFNRHGELRNKPGMDVCVGNHIPDSGGPNITFVLMALLEDVNDNELSPYALHREFEALHPFMDGNGRTGRAIWLWQMVKHHNYNLSLGFLHKWYYQSLGPVSDE